MVTRFNGSVAAAVGTTVVSLFAASGAARADNVGPLSFLVSHGGPINPGVLVGFNPQPDPPGVPPTSIDLGNSFAPRLSNIADGGTFAFDFALQGLGALVIPLPAAPNADGVTGFSQRLDGHLIEVNFIFGGGPVVPGSWVEFNPQPDPPGDVMSADLAFVGDPTVSFDVRIDGDQLSFSAAPEPATWVSMLIGCGLAGAVLRRRSRPVVARAQGAFQ